MNYRKILKAFILLNLFSGFLFCGQKEDDIALAKKLHFPKEENASMSMYIKWLKTYGDEFENHDVKEIKAKESLNSFFASEKYIVISNEKYKAHNNTKIYVAIKECPEVRRGATKGIFVDENGKQLLFFDMKRGVYTPEKTILDLSKLGFKDESPLCFVIGGNVNMFFLQMIDKDKCVITTYYYWDWEKKPNKISHYYYLYTEAIEGKYNKRSNQIEFSVFCDGDYGLGHNNSSSNDSNENRYYRRKKDFQAMNQYKAKGYRVYVPEKPLKEDVEIAKNIKDSNVKIPK